MTRQEIRDRVLDLWGNNSARVIGNMVGLTRNAVIGIVHRAKNKDERAVTKLSIDTGRKMSSLYWTDQEISRLRQLINNKMRVEDITYALEEEFGTFRSESSVRKKMSRLGLRAPYNAQANKVGFKNVSTPEQAQRARKTSQTRLERVEAETSANPKNIIDIGYGECRFPIGDSEGDQLFCADRTKQHSSYCTRHHDICKVKYVERSRRRA